MSRKALGRALRDVQKTRRLSKWLVDKEVIDGWGGEGVDCPIAILATYKTADYIYIHLLNWHIAKILLSSGANPTCPPPPCKSGFAHAS